MLKVIEQTDEEKYKMYMKYTKKELIKILINCNEIIQNVGEMIYIRENAPDRKGRGK